MSARLSSLGAELAGERRAWLEARPAPDPEVELAAIRATIAERARSTSRLGRPVIARGALLLAATLSTLAALWLLLPRGERVDLGAVAADNPVHVGDRLMARTQPVEVAFSDGSRVELATGGGGGRGAGWRGRRAAAGAWASGGADRARPGSTLAAARRRSRRRGRRHRVRPPLR